MNNDDRAGMVIELVLTVGSEQYTATVSIAHSTLMYARLRRGMIEQAFINGIDHVNRQMHELRSQVIDLQRENYALRKELGRHG